MRHWMWHVKGMTLGKVALVSWGNAKEGSWEPSSAVCCITASSMLLGMSSTWDSLGSGHVLNALQLGPQSYLTSSHLGNAKFSGPTWSDRGFNWTSLGWMSWGTEKQLPLGCLSPWARVISGRGQRKKEKETSDLWSDVKPGYINTDVSPPHVPLHWSPSGCKRQRSSQG